MLVEFESALRLLSDAESAEDQVEDVVSGGGAGDRIERPQGAVEIKQQHFMWDFCGHGAGSSLERGQRFLYESLVAHICKKSGFGLRPCFATDVAKNLGA